MPGGDGRWRRHDAPRSRSASKDELLRFYREMLLIRRFEEKAGQLYGMGLIGGFCHLYIGQEAVVVGLESTAKDGDQRVTTYRDHGHMLACGMDPKGVMAELTGRVGRLLQGQGRLDAHVLEGEGLLRRPRHRRGQRADRRRPRLRQQVPRQRQRRLHLLRRRRGEPGAGLRDLQHGEPLEAAGDLRHREQPVRDGHLAEARAPRRRRSTPAARPSASPARRWTAWTCWRSATPG